MAFRKVAKKAAKKVVKTAKRGKKNGAGAAVHLPDGYKVIGRAPNWDVDKSPVIEGVRGEIKQVTLNAGTKQEKETNCMVVVTEDLGALTVWESAGLRDLFEQTEDGDTVRIEYVETLEPRRKGQQGMRVFSCAVKE
jgi:hypothetical protein